MATTIAPRVAAAPAGRFGALTATGLGGTLAALAMVGVVVAALEPSQPAA